MNEGFPATEQYACGVLALRYRIVPMFDPPPLVSEDRVRIIRYISSRQNVGVVRFEEFVDDNTIVDL